MGGCPGAVKWSSLRLDSTPRLPAFSFSKRTHTYIHTHTLSLSRSPSIQLAPHHTRGPVAQVPTLARFYPFSSTRRNGLISIVHFRSWILSALCGL